MKNRLIVDIY